MSLEDIDREIMQALADEDLGTYDDAVFTAPGSTPVTAVYVVVEDLISETTGEITQGGATLSLLRSQVGTAVQGSTVAVNGETWRISRRLSSTDPSMLKYEAHRS